MADIRSLETQVVELQQRVTWLLDKEAIRNLKQLYCRFSDNGRFDEFETLFTDDFTCQINGPPGADGKTPPPLEFPSRTAWVTFARTQGALRAQVDATAGAAGPRKESADGSTLAGVSAWSPGAGHHMHGGEIEFTAPGAARAIWPSQFDGINGYYDEEYRKVDGRWKIARERFFAQARREYHLTDHPYALEVGRKPEDLVRQRQIDFA